MTIRTDRISVNWELSPRVITVASPYTEVTIQDLVDTCRYLEAQPEAMDDDHLINAAGKEPLGGTTSVGLTATLNNAVVAFAPRGGPNWVLCEILGGNLVATDDNGNALDPRLPTAYVSVDRTASSSATLIGQETLPDDVADAVWSEDITTYTVSGTAGKTLHDVSNQGVSVDNSAIADEVWDRDLSLHTTVGSAGKIVSDIETLTIRALGLMQENYYLDNTTYTTYNGMKLMTNGRIRVYSVAGSVGTANDVLSTYTITASWTNDELDSYKVVKT